MEEGGAEVKGAFRSVQTPSAPSAEEEVISTFGEFLMKAEQPVRGGGAGGRAGRRGQGRGAAVARLLAPGYITNTSGDQPLMQVR